MADRPENGQAPGGKVEDQRRHVRVGPAFPAVLNVPGSPPRTGTLGDISFSGVFLEVDTRGLSETPCTLRIALDEQGRAIVLNGVILRITPRGVAIRKESVEGLEGYQDLLNLIAYNSGDAARVERETRNR